MNGLAKVLPLVIFLLIVFDSCQTNPVEPDDQSGKITFQFKHRVDGQDIVFDTLIYTNKSGNKYLVNEIQYFISDVTLHNASDEEQVLDAWNDILYIDTDISETFMYSFPDKIDPGSYQSVSFTFGINEQKNQSLMFVNPPESFMFWPELLGGGYHYMKLNGKWLDTLNQISPFNFHLGIGQDYYSFPDSITGYIQNYFKVHVPASDFEVISNQTTNLTLVMNVENWFQTPNDYDHNEWGGDIMQKQDAMYLACENGVNVFTIEK